VNLINVSSPSLFFAKDHGAIDPSFRSHGNRREASTRRALDLLTLAAPQRPILVALEIELCGGIGERANRFNNTRIDTLEQRQNLGPDAHAHESFVSIRWIAREIEAVSFEVEMNVRSTRMNERADEVIRAWR
jgi:hypothetical protein